MKIVKILIVIVAAVLLLVIVDFPYIQSNVNYFLHPPKAANPSAILTVSSGKLKPRGEMPTLAQPNNLIIESLGINLPVVYTEETSESGFQKALINGVVHYPKTALPGEYGNCYIFGHSSDLIWSKGNYKTAFAALPKIKIGQQIKITGQDGRLYNYKVIETKVVEPDDESVLSQGEHKKRLLTLQTSYPLGTALRRFIAVAEME